MIRLMSDSNGPSIDFSPLTLLAERSGWDFEGTEEFPQILLQESVWRTPNTRIAVIGDGMLAVSYLAIEGSDEAEVAQVIEQAFPRGFFLNQRELIERWTAEMQTQGPSLPAAQYLTKLSLVQPRDEEVAVDAVRGALRSPHWAMRRTAAFAAGHLLGDALLEDAPNASESLFALSNDLQVCAGEEEHEDVRNVLVSILAEAERLGSGRAFGPRVLLELQAEAGPAYEAAAIESAKGELESALRCIIERLREGAPKAERPHLHAAARQLLQAAEDSEAIRALRSQYVIVS